MILTIRRLLHILIILFPILFSGCKSDIVKRLDARFSEHNRLLYHVSFSLKDTGDAFIEYWIREDSSRLITTLSSAKRDHQISIINLLPDKTYEYRIRANYNGKIRQSNIYQFKTDTLPSELPAFTLIKNDYDLKGYILLKAFFDPGALILLNQKAEIVWYQLYDSTIVRPFEFTFDGNMLSLVDSSIIEETSLDGKLLRRINTKEHGIDKIHHELFKNMKSQYIGLTYTENMFDLSHLGGNRQDTIHADGVVVMDSIGRKVWEWDIFDFADPLKDDSIQHRKKDWGHANSIAYDTDGNYLISFRDFSQIWKIDSQSGEIMWKLGRNGDFEIEGTEWFLNQHDAHISPEGFLLMFDNGNNQRGYSRILALDVDEQSYTCFPVIDIKLTQSQTTFRMGSAQMINDKHILVCSPKKRLNLSIYNTQGKIVWEVSATKDSYRAYFLSRDKIEVKRWF